MSGEPAFRFDPVDVEMIRLTMSISVGARVQRLLDTRAIRVSMIRSRLRAMYPALTLRNLNMKVLEEIERVERQHTRPLPVHPHLADTGED